MPEIIELVTADQVPLGTVKRFEINDLAVAIIHTDEGFFALEENHKLQDNAGMGVNKCVQEGG